MRILFPRMLLFPLLTIFLLLMLDAFLISHQGDMPSIYQESHALRFPSFRTKDLQGNVVTQDIFTGKFSVVCLWVMQDPSASRELLGTLSAWQAASPDPFQLIGIVGDLRDTDTPEQIATARSIIRGIPEDMPQLMINDDFADFLQRIRNAPTVCFVDEQGALIGQPIAGNEPSLIQKEAERLMKADSTQAELEKKIQDSLFRHP